MAKIMFPEAQDLTPMLRDLLGKDVSVQAASGDADSDPARLRAFVSDADEPLVLCGADMAFAMYAGAALAMIPAGRANDAIASGVPDEDLFEIYLEVVNVLTRSVNDIDNPHVRLIPGSTADGIDMSAFVESTVLEIDIQGYGIGRLSFWRTPELVEAV